MNFQGAEDRLNPIAPEGADETTLGGYPLVHGRAPSFEGVDGRPYSVAIDAEPNDAPSGGWVAYLVFLRWADTGTAIMGHVETPDLAAGATEQEARAHLEALPLPHVKEILDDLLRRNQEEDALP
jgi:hypothetical protein